MAKVKIKCLSRFKEENKKEGREKGGCFKRPVGAEFKENKSQSEALVISGDDWSRSEKKVSGDSLFFLITNAAEFPSTLMKPSHIRCYISVARG